MPNYVDQINLNGNVGDIKGCGDDRYYPGVDLTVQFATEILCYSDPWEWLTARIRLGEFSQLHVLDYIPVTCTNGVKFNARIAGINTYKGYGDTAVPNRMDFVAGSLWPVAVQMNKVNVNNGMDSDTRFPWLCSNGYHFLNSLTGNVLNEMFEIDEVDYTTDGVYTYLPEDLQKAIVTKRLFLPYRQSVSSLLPADNGGDWVDIGKLWLPTETEITGAPMWSSVYSAMGSVQYPMFANNMARMIEHKDWPTLSAATDSTSEFVIVNQYGLVCAEKADHAVYAPVCFRVT